MTLPPSLYPRFRTNEYVVPGRVPTRLKPVPVWVVGCVAALLTCFVVRTYLQVAVRDHGDLSALIVFGSANENQQIGALRKIAHFVVPEPAGYDGQYYAQLALDPTLRASKFDVALDNPTYRARRIGLPLFAHLLGLGQARWVLQAYALANLLFWLLLLGVLLVLMRPWTIPAVLCLSSALLGVGALNSMSRALTDLPATALIFAALRASFRPATAWLAGATLVRDTSLLAAVAAIDPARTWQRNLIRVGLVAAPFLLWLVYVNVRFRAGVLPDPGAGDNFSLPLQAFLSRFERAYHQFLQTSYTGTNLLTAWYDDFPLHQVIWLVSVRVQGCYLLARSRPKSKVWRIGLAYLGLSCCLGPAVWAESFASSRVVMPITIACFVQLAREPEPWVFWPVLILTNLATPYACNDFSLRGG